MNKYDIYADKADLKNDEPMARNEPLSKVEAHFMRKKGLILVLVK